MAIEVQCPSCRFSGVAERPVAMSSIPVYHYLECPKCGAIWVEWVALPNFR